MRCANWYAETSMTSTYTQSPRPVGGPITFTLNGDRLTVDTGRKIHQVRLDAVETVRMTFEPGRIGRKTFRTAVTMKDGKTFSITSLSWKSLIDAQDMGGEYRAFVRGLCRATAEANPQARFLAGKAQWLWLATAALSALSLVAMAILIWRALQMGSTRVALMGALFVALGVWQIEPMIRLNKPRPFRPDAPPPELMPHAA